MVVVIGYKEVRLKANAKRFEGNEPENKFEARLNLTLHQITVTECHKEGFELTFEK